MLRFILANEELRRLWLWYITVIILSFTILLSLLSPLISNAQTDTGGLTKQRLLNATNNVRKSHGRHELELHGALNNVAERRAIHMRNNHYYGHTHNGETYLQIKEAKELGYTSKTWYMGENLFISAKARTGSTASEDVVNAWAKSPSHLENMLLEGYNIVGFGWAFAQEHDQFGTIIVAIYADEITTPTPDPNPDPKPNLKPTTQPEATNPAKEEKPKPDSQPSSGQLTHESEHNLTANISSDETTTLEVTADDDDSDYNDTEVRTYSNEVDIDDLSTAAQVDTSDNSNTASSEHETETDNNSSSTDTQAVDVANLRSRNATLQRKLRVLGARTSAQNTNTTVAISQRPQTDQDTSQDETPTSTIIESAGETLPDTGPGTMIVQLLLVTFIAYAYKLHKYAKLAS